MAYLDDHPQDFFRKTAGTALPDGASDYTAPISHNGSVGIGIGYDPRFPLELRAIRPDVLCLFDNNSAASNPHQIYGFGLEQPFTSTTGGGVPGFGVRYQVPALGNTGHGFYGGASATASKALMRIVDRKLTIGDPSVPIGEGHWTIGTSGDDGYIRFMAPDASVLTNKIQAEMFLNSTSGNNGRNDSTFTIATALAGANAVTNRFHINGSGDVLIGDAVTPYTTAPTSSALLTVNGAIRVRSGPIAVGATARQQNGIVFGAGGAAGATTTGTETDGGITSLGDGNITFYTQGAIAGAVNTGGVWSKPGGGLWAATSDSRTKKNVTRTTGTLAKLLQLSPVRFQYNGLAGTPDGGAYYDGLIAEEVQKVFPAWVTESREKIDDKPVLQVDSSPLVYALLEAVRELKGEIDKLKGVASEAVVTVTTTSTTSTAPLSVNMVKVDRLLKMDAAGLSAIGFTATQATTFMAGSTALRAGFASGLPESELLKVLSTLLTSIGLTLAGVMAKL